MADKTPVRGAYNGGSLTGLAEYASGDTVSVGFGGTGATSLTDNGILIGNATSAIQTSGDLTFDGTTFATTAFTATGNVSLDGGTFIFNESGADKDFRIEGDTAVNLFISDASTDRIGIGTATPSHLLDVEGVGHAATCFVSADLCATTKVVAPALCIGSQYVLPTADGSAGQLMCTDGSGALAFATATAGVTLAGSTNNTVATVTGANALAGEANLTFDGSTLTVAGALSATGNISFDGGSFVFNESGADKDFRIEGDTDANLFVADASTDRIGIGTATPGAKLQIVQANNDYATRVTSATDGDYKAQISIEGEVGIFKLWADGSASGDDPGITLNGSTGIGIGTATPAGPLEVIMAAGAPVRITDPSASTTASEPQLGFYGSTNGTTRMGYIGKGSTANNEFRIVNSQNDAMYFGTNDTERMRITSAGQVGIGTAAPNARLTIWNSDVGTAEPHADADEFVIEGSASSGRNTGMSILACCEGMATILAGTCGKNCYGMMQWNMNTGCFCFHNNGTQVLSMDYLGVANFCNQTSAQGGFSIISGSATVPRGIAINFVNTTCVCQSSYYAYWYGGAGEKFIVLASGNVTNANNSYGAISDENRKQDITDARSYWDDFKGIRFRKFRFKSDVKEDANAPELFGVVAQELETVFPGLIEESVDKADRDVPSLDKDGNQTYTTNEEGEQIPDTESRLTDLDTKTKSVKYSVLSQIGLKVIQELQIRLEAAESKLTAQEAEIAILKG